MFRFPEIHFMKFNSDVWGFTDVINVLGTKTDQMLCLFLIVDGNSSGRPAIRSVYWWPKLNPGAAAGASPPDAEKQIWTIDCIIGLMFPNWSVQSNLRHSNSNLCWNQRKDNSNEFINVAVVVFVSDKYKSPNSQSLKWPQ